MALAVLLWLGCCTVAWGMSAPEEWMPTGFLPHRFGPMDVNVFPMGYYTPDTGVALGVGAWFIKRNADDPLPDGKPNNIWLSGVYTVQRQTIVQAIPELFWFGGGLRLRVHLRYEDYPTQFFGLGNETRKSDEETYTSVSRRSRITLTQRIVARFSVGSHAEYVQTDITEVVPGRQLDTGVLPGSERSEVAGLGIVALWDSREHHFNPRGGSYAELSAVGFRDRLGERYAYTRTSLDLRHYESFGAWQVLGLQFQAQSVSDEAPFTELPRLGGRSLLRGYLEGRFRDRYLLATQLEHRIHFSGRWGGVWFLAAGAVSGEPVHFAADETHEAGGFGLRYIWNVPERINLRFDVAATRESAGVYFSVGEAF